MTTTIANLLELDLTAAFLESLDCAPIVAGDTIDLRLQVLDEDGAAVDLTDAIVVFTLRRSDTDAEAAFQLLTPTDVVIDADQTSSAATIAGTNDTGRGWFEVRLRPAHETDLSACAPARNYDIRITFADDSVREFARGRCEVMRPRTKSAEFTPAP